MVRAASHSAMRFARRLARREGVALGRFRLMPGTDESTLGREWVADAVRGGGWAKVWLPISEADVNEALSACTACRSFGGRVFGVTIRGRADPAKEEIVAKTKNLTAADIIAGKAAAAYAAELATTISEAVNACRADELPRALEVARSLVAAARDLNDAAVALMSHHQSQQ